MSADAKAFAAKMCGLILTNGVYLGPDPEWECKQQDWFSGPQAWVHMGMLIEAMSKAGHKIVVAETERGHFEASYWTADGHSLCIDVSSDLPTAVLLSAHAACGDNTGEANDHD